MSFRGVIRRRLLVNFRVDPAIMRPLVPAAFDLRLVDGWAITGMCLIRLELMRPNWMPVRLGMSSENVAYRTGVIGPDGPAVYISHRDTGSVLQAAAGRRLVPTQFAKRSIESVDDATGTKITVRAADGTIETHVVATAAGTLPATSAFKDERALSAYFEQAAVGWSPSDRGGIDGVELRVHRWEVAPMVIDALESAYFDDRRRFPPGSIALDAAVVMRHTSHEWHPIGAMSQ